MKSLPSDWLDPLIRFRYVIAALLLGGLLLWAWNSQRRPGQPLSFPSRLSLAALLALMPFTWWLTGQSSERIPRVGPEEFDARTYASMGINRMPDKIEGKYIARFQTPDGTPYLFLHAPGSLTFTLREQDRSCEIGYGFMPTAYTNGGHTNGAILRVEIHSTPGKTARLFEYYAMPVEREADRHLLHAAITLPKHQSGDELVVSFLPGINNDESWDHTFIKHLALE